MRRRTFGQRFLTHGHRLLDGRSIRCWTVVQERALVGRSFNVTRAGRADMQGSCHMAGGRRDTGRVTETVMPLEPP